MADALVECHAGYRGEEAPHDFRIVCLECEAELDDPFAWDLALPG